MLMFWLGIVRLPTPPPPRSHDFTKATRTNHSSGPGKRWRRTIPLWSPYRAKRYWFAAWDLGRRSLLTGLLTLVPSFDSGGSHLRVTVACTIAGVSLVVGEVSRPHHDPWIRWVYRMVRSGPGRSGYMPEGPLRALYRQVMLGYCRHRGRSFVLPVVLWRAVILLGGLLGHHAFGWEQKCVWYAACRCCIQLLLLRRPCSSLELCSTGGTPNVCANELFCFPKMLLSTSSFCGCSVSHLFFRAPSTTSRTGSIL